MAKRRELVLTEEAKQELIEYRDHHDRPDVREKAAALLKIAEGASAHWVSVYGLLKRRKPDTVYRWLDIYEAEGFDGLIRRQHGGARRRFSKKKAEELLERVRQAPDEVVDKGKGVCANVPIPSRWTLRTLRSSVDWLEGYTLSGVYRVLTRCGLRLRSGRVQQYSPDPEYSEKVSHLCSCLQQAVCNPGKQELVFLDEMGYSRWPEAGRVWTPSPPGSIPVASCDSNNQQWRLIGALNALTGQVCYLDNYIVGRAKVIEMYQKLTEIYPQAETLYVVQDNWSIHKHQDVLDALSELPQIEPVWLPTYAPWLNPIEKLWRWLRVDVFKMHRFASEWEEFRGRVNGFLDQFAGGSEDLLRYVGLKGDGLLANACKPV